jgi:hypothetical protein
MMPKWFPSVWRRAETAAIPPAMVAAIFANTEHHVGLCPRAESIFCNPAVSASTKVFFIGFVGKLFHDL